MVNMWRTRFFVHPKHFPAGCQPLCQGSFQGGKTLQKRRETPASTDIRRTIVPSISPWLKPETPLPWSSSSTGLSTRLRVWKNSPVSVDRRTGKGLWSCIPMGWASWGFRSIGTLDTAAEKPQTIRSTMWDLLPQPLRMCAAALRLIVTVSIWWGFPMVVC